jgi:hypothetical protein
MEYNDDVNPYGETLATTQQRPRPTSYAGSVAASTSYQSRLPVADDGVERIRLSKVMEDGSTVEDIYALPAKRKGLPRYSVNSDLVDNPIYET